MNRSLKTEYRWDDWKLQSVLNRFRRNKGLNSSGLKSVINKLATNPQIGPKHRPLRPYYTVTALWPSRVGEDKFLPW